MDFGLTVYFLNHYGYIVSEGNIFVSNGYLLLVINGVQLLSIFIAAFIIGKYKTVPIASKSVFGYLKELYLRGSLFFIIIIGCFSFIMASFASRGTAIFDWIIFGIYKEDFFQTNYSIIKLSMPLERYDVIVGLITVFLSIPLWFILEYKKSKKLILELGSNNENS